MELGPETLGLGLVWYVVFLFSTTLHEAGHALAALKLGDPTAYHGGQVSLSPIPHVRREIFGTVVAPILTFLWIGWMMGWASAPYDPLWADRHPRRAAWMALAGPAANLLLVLAAAVLIRAGLLAGYFEAPEASTFTQVVAATSPGIGEALATLLSVLLMLNLLLLAFNLLPLPPLDGSAALPLLLPERLVRPYQQFMRQPMLGWLGILVAWRVFQPLFGYLHLFALNVLLYPGAGYS